MTPREPCTWPSRPTAAASGLRRLFAAIASVFTLRGSLARDANARILRVLLIGLLGSIILVASVVPARFVAGLPAGLVLLLVEAVFCASVPGLLRLVCVHIHAETVHSSLPAGRS